MAKKKYKDNLSRPFELPLTKQQNKLYNDMKKLFSQEYVIGMTYPELFDVIERVKFSYQLDLARRKGLITFNDNKND